MIVPYDQIINLASKMSLVTLLVLIILGGSQGFWVFGSQYTEMVAERNTWKELALKGTSVAQQVARPLITGAPPDPLPSNPTPAQVNAKLEDIRNESGFKYLTEPTDKPLQ